MREDDEIEIDEATTLEVINLFKGMDAESKKIALEENFATLESLKKIVEGEKDVELVDEQEDGSEKTHFTDSKNLLEIFKTYYDDDAAPLITEYTKYLHDSNGRIVYKRKYARDAAGNIERDANGSIRVFELDAKGHKIPIEDTSNERKVAGSVLGTAFDIAATFDSLEKIFTGKVKGTERTAEIAKLSSAIASLSGNIRSLLKIDKAGVVAPIVSSLLGLTGSIISLTDGAEPEEITEVVRDALQATTITAKYVLDPKFATTKIGQLLGGQSFVTAVTPFAEKLTANALKVNMVGAVMLGIFMGGVQYFKSDEQYQIDGLKDSLATKNKWIDSLTTGIKTFYSVISLGLDDALWGALSSKISGANKKNYDELFGDFLKIFISNQYTGSKEADTQ